MVSVLRKIDKGDRWAYSYPKKEEDFPADPLGDLLTTDNSLSVYFFEDEASLKIIELALASNRDYIKPLEYLILKLDELRKMGFEFKEYNGDTKIEAANNLHRNIVNLTADKLIILAKSMLKGMVNEGCHIYKTPKEVKKIVNEGIQCGKISKVKLSPEMVEKL